MKAALIAAVVLLCVGLVECSEDKSDGANGSSGGISKTDAPATSDSKPTIGATVKVGDLDLTVIEARTVNTTSYNQFNTANYAIHIQAINARGAKDKQYNLNTLAFKLVDDR